MLKCELEHSIDCRTEWDVTRTSHGSCITLNINKAYDFEMALGKLKNNYYGQPEQGKTPKLSKRIVDAQFGDALNATMKAAIQS